MPGRQDPPSIYSHKPYLQVAWRHVLHLQPGLLLPWAGKQGKELGACFPSLKTAMSLQEQRSQEHIWALKPSKPKDKQKAMKLNWAVGNEGSKCCRLLHRRGCSASAVPSGNCTLLTPCPAVLQHIPMPVLYGVFLHMGVAALNSIQVSGGYARGAGGVRFGNEGACSIPALTPQQSLDFISA